MDLAEKPIDSSRQQLLVHFTEIIKESLPAWMSVGLYDSSVDGTVWISVGGHIFIDEISWIFKLENVNSVY